MSAAGVVVDFAEYFAIIGGARDPLRAVWDEKASLSDRRLLLSMARATAGEALLWAGRAWCDLPAETRANIVGGLRRFKGWAERLGQ